MERMYALLADLVVTIHFGFVAFVALGSLLLLRWPDLWRVHLPAAVWGAGIEILGGICPLTHLENELRHRAGAGGYSESFVSRYLLGWLYPEGLTRDAQLALGAAVIAGNVIAYLWIFGGPRLRMGGRE